MAIQPRFSAVKFPSVDPILASPAPQGLVKDLRVFFDAMWTELEQDLNTRLLITNLGSVTITGAATTGTFTFPAGRVEPNTTYFVVATPITVTGAAAAGASRIRSIAKTATAVTLTVEAAPAGVTSVAFDVVIFRDPAP